jgi:hypothetical protein
VFFQGLLGFPALEQHDGGFRPLLVENVTSGTTGLGPQAPLDGSKNLQDSVVSVRRWQESHRSDKHACHALRDPCRGGL